MKKKNTILIITIIGLLVLGGILFGYKYSVLNRYKYTSEKDMHLIESETWKIDSKTLDPSEYLTLGDIKIKNEFSQFEKKTDEDSKDIVYVLKNEEGIGNTGWSYLQSKSFTGSLVENFTNLGKETKAEKSIKKFMDAHKFKNDIEFIKYLIEWKEEKVNLFTSTKEIEESYAVRYLKDNLLVDGQFHSIEGKYTGYVVENDDKYEVNLIAGDKKYIITFKNKGYFSKEKVLDLISTIEIA